jgi:uroporphyrinogen decarboxylase
MKREAVQTSLQHKSPGYCVWQVNSTKPMAEKLQAHIGDQDLDEYLGNHMAFFRIMGEFKDLGSGRFMDQFGVVWNKSVDPDIGAVEGTVIGEHSDLKTTVFPDPDDPAKYRHVSEFVTSGKDRFLVSGPRHSLFERAWMMRGMEDLLVDMIECTEFVDELLDKIVAYDLGVIRNLHEFPIDAVWFGDDYGQQHGLIMGSKLWRRFIKPRLQILCSEAKRKAGVSVILHSCGDVTEIFDDLIEVGVDVFNPLQPEAMDIFDVAARYGDRLSFYGGISIQNVLPFGNPSEVRSHVEQAIQGIGRNGGYICSPAHDMPADIPVENIEAMLDVLKGQ